ncbi:glycosyltransferase, partial [Vibrio splendidus]
MKFSVIVTVYNLEKYIEASLLSIINQTYNNFEVIVVNDCSTDNSLNVINNYSNRVRLVNLKKNSGVLLATCAGLKEANGDIICFLDGDDIWESNKLQRLAEIYGSNEYYLVSHDYSHINSEGNAIDIDDSSQELINSISPQNIDEISDILTEGIMVPKGRIWLGSAFSLNTKYFDVNNFLDWVNNLSSPTMIYQDWPIAVYALATKKGNVRVGYVQEKLFRYRLHESNYSGGNKSTNERSIKIAKKGKETSKEILNLLVIHKASFTKEDYLKIKNHRDFM